MKSTLWAFCLSYDLLRVLVKPENLCMGVMKVASIDERIVKFFSQNPVLIR